MMIVRMVAALAIALVLLTSEMSGQNSTGSPSDASSEPAINTWSFSASASTYFVPHSHVYASPVFTADHGWLHLEARYNYEALKTGSTWIGYNFKHGEKWVLEVSPMVAGVFGDLDGIAPGWNLSLSHGKFELSSQNEFVFDLRDRSGNFFYSWAEFSYSPLDWFRFGIVSQRTKAYQTDLDIQRGLLAGFSYKKVNLTTYVFNFGWTDPTVVVTIGVDF
ncbi:MAG TPA: hypothetical protein VMW38_22165 [Terriglobia bacterium]|nr:hypothetical protein [Terriglobia bacterium]